MADLPSRNDLKIGLEVEIETKKDQGTGRLTAGILDKILTGAMTHPYGIKVKLQDGQVGRVKKISGSPATTQQGRAAPDDQTLQPKDVPSPVPEEPTESFADLNAIPIPKTEDVYNEFKEFYQYEKTLERFLVLKGGAERQSIKGIMRTVRSRFATAVCSFGNDKTGGFVYLGINADGKIVGLERDKKLGNFKDYDDEFANHITDTLLEFLKDRVFILSNIKIKFRRVEGKTICILQVQPASRPLYLHHNNEQYFYVRGPAPRAVSLGNMYDQIRYIRERFPNYVRV